MAVPKRKISISRKRIRNYPSRVCIVNSTYNYSVCPKCNFIKKKHHLCVSCGYYNENTNYKK